MVKDFHAIKKFSIIFVIFKKRNIAGKQLKLLSCVEKTFTFCCLVNVRS